MDKYGLIGYPLGHSFSIGYFNEKFHNEHINAAYINFEIPSIDDFIEVVDSNPELRGLNVTIPYKEQVIDYLDSLSPEAKAIGAVNVIRVTHKGSKTLLKGFNSDVIGFTRSIEPLLERHHRKALILGTGGASKAVNYGLKSLGLETMFVSRTKRNGVLTYDEITPGIVREYNVIVNCTPLGMYPKTDVCPALPYEAMDSHTLLYDLLYNPDETLFMAKGREQGAVVKNGLEMLLLQAFASWEFHGRNRQTCTVHPSRQAPSDPLPYRLPAQDIRRLLCETGCSVLRQELLVAESPQHADTGQTAVFRRHDIHVAVADIHGSLFRCIQLAESLEHRVGSRLFADGFPFADSHLDRVGEEVAGQFLGGRIEFVADDGQLLAASLQLTQQFRNTVVRTGRVKVMQHIMFTESGVGSLESGVVRSVRNGTLHEQSDTVPHEHTHFFHCPFRHACPSERIVRTRRQIAQCTQQRTVQVENVCIKIFHYPFVLAGQNYAIIQTTDHFFS